MTTTCRNKMIVALSAFCVLLSLSLIRGQQETNRDEVIPSIKVDDVSLSDCVKNLARQAGFNFILDPYFPPDADVPPVNFTLKNISAKDALDRVLKLRGLVRIENPVTSVTRIALVKLGIKPVSREQLGTDTNAVLPLIMFDEVPLKDAVRALAGQLHMKINFDRKFMAAPGYDDFISSLSVSARWKNLTAKQALVALLDNYDLLMIEDQSGSNARITIKEKVPKSNSP